MSRPAPSVMTAEMMQGGNKHTAFCCNIPPHPKHEAMSTSRSGGDVPVRSIRDEYPECCRVEMNIQHSAVTLRDLGYASEMMGLDMSGA